MSSAPVLSDLSTPEWSAADPATLVFVRENGHLLLIRKKRGLGAGKINGPGGRIDPGESPLDCARREVEEELLVTPTGMRLAGENRFQFVDGYSIHVFIYSASGLVGKPRETDEAIPLWRPIDDLPYDEMWQDDSIWLPHLIAGRHFSGRFLFDGDRMLEWELDLA